MKIEFNKKEFELLLEYLEMGIKGQQLLISQGYSWTEETQERNQMAQKLLEELKE